LRHHASSTAQREGPSGVVLLMVSKHWLLAKPDAIRGGAGAPLAGAGAD